VSARDYLSIAEVVASHEELIRRYGGRAGIRDGGALEAAMFRPQTGYYADSVEEGAALFESLAMNHPFVDGNKRVAFAVTDVFLRLNDYRIERLPLRIHADLMKMFDTDTLDIAHLEPWRRKIVIQAK
jgi:death on curing protein